MRAARLAYLESNPITDETREKIAASKRGRPRPDLMGKPRPDLAERNRLRRGIPRPDVAERNRVRANKPPEPSA